MRKKTRKEISKKELVKRRRIRKVRAICVLLCAFFTVIFLIKVIGNRDIKIDSNQISYYINLSDANSRPKGQLNWKEIASIDAATHDKKFLNSDENTIKVISNYFYSDDKSNKVLNFEEALENARLTNRQKDRAKDILEDLKGVSLRVKYDGDSSNKAEFINRLVAPAEEVYKKYGVFPSISIAQAILESSWGKSELASKYNNYYGIKATTSWTGAVVNFSTQENYNDTIQANFRVYNSVEESINDLGQFLKNNSRYSNNGVFSSNNYIEQANAIERAGYATTKDENGELIYGDKLINVIRENNLMIYDNLVLKQ